MKTKFTFFLILILLMGCSSNEEEDCSLVLCLGLELNIELIDKTTGANYIDFNKLELTDFTFSVDGNSGDFSGSVFLYKNSNNASILNIPFAVASSIAIKDDKKYLY